MMTLETTRNPAGQNPRLGICPSSRHLLLAAWGELSDQYLIPILEHAAGCRVCLNRMEAFEEIEDRYWARRLGN